MRLCALPYLTLRCRIPANNHVSFFALKSLSSLLCLVLFAGAPVVDAKIVFCG